MVIKRSRWAALLVTVSQPHAVRASLRMLSPARTIQSGAALKILVFILLLAWLVKQGLADPLPSDEETQAPLKQLTLEQLGNIEVTTTSKEPEKVSHTPAAIYVITQEDIRRSGATSIPEVLRLAPGVEVARTDSDHCSVGIRGFGGQLSSKLLVLIDGRSVYTPLYAGV